MPVLCTEPTVVTVDLPVRLSLSSNILKTHWKHSEALQRSTAKKHCKDLERLASCIGAPEASLSRYMLSGAQRTLVMIKPSDKTLFRNAKAVTSGCKFILFILVPFDPFAYCCYLLGKTFSPEVCKSVSGKTLVLPGPCSDLESWRSKDSKRANASVGSRFWFPIGFRIQQYFRCTSWA